MKVKLITIFLLKLYSAIGAVLLRVRIFRRVISQPLSYLCLLVLSLTLHSSPAFSYGCTAAAPISLSTNNIQFNRDIPLYQMIGSEMVSNSTTLATCDNTFTPPTEYNLRNGLGFQSTVSITQINGKAIYATNIPGIGYSIGMELTSPCNITIWSDRTADCSTDTITWPSTTPTIFKGRYRVQLYKTGPISNTNNVQITVKSNAVVSYILGVPNGARPVYRTFYPVTIDNLNIATSTCSLQSGSTTAITLPTISRTSLSSINSISGNMPFNIIINCPSLTNLNITFTDNSNNLNTGTYLIPMAGSTAKGVGIQLTYNGKIIAFGPDSSATGTAGQIVLNSNLIGTQSFPFTASYVRTGAITPGSLSARATFTLSYQ